MLAVAVRRRRPARNAHHITDATRAAALRLVRSGRLYDLGRVLDEDVPAFPGRYFRQTLVTTAHHANGGGLGANRVNWITEQIAGTQQIGTHLDALTHLADRRPRIQRLERHRT